MNLQLSSLPSIISEQIKESFMKSKSQQCHKWSLTLFGISIYLVGFLKKHILPVFTQKLGFGQCPLCAKLTTDIVIIPCSHFSHCYECELKKTLLKEYICSVCNNNYEKSIKVYL